MMLKSLEMNCMLYLVATPIGNLLDITFRAVETLKNCDFIVAENPKHTLKLLRHYDIKPKKLIQFAEHNEQRVLPTLISKLKSENACLTTDAGTPGISDPGFRLVRACVGAGIKVTPIPGPSALLAALSASGLPTDRFLFVGFLPKTETKILNLINLGENADSSIVAFDSPFRIKKTVEIIAKHFPQSHLAIAREITKIHEEFIRGTAREVSIKLNQTNKIKGELTLVISFK